MTFPRMLCLSASILGALAGCGSQTIDSGTQKPNPSESVDGGADSSEPVDAGPSLHVNYLTQSVSVDLTTLGTVKYKDMDLVKLSDVWTASKMEADRNTLEFEFVGSDGFKPSDKNNCADLPGSVLDKGYINPVSRKLSWDESLGFAGCYSVKDADKMNAHAPSAGDAGATDATTD